MIEIIAEIGINHNGDINIAKKLIEEAKLAGADCVKFQTFFIEELARQHTPKSDFQMKDTSSSSHSEMLRKCQLSYEDHQILFDYCKKLEINFLSTPYHPSAVSLLEELGVQRYKVASADLRDVFLIDAILNTKKKIILSTGMSNQEDVLKTLDYIIETKGYDKEKISLLHCTSDYPCEDKDGNLNFLRFLKNFDIEVGFSDHSLGSKQALIALGLGATIFEKHITLDKNAAGPDHNASSDIDEFKIYIEDLNSGFLSLGFENKNTTAAERSMKYTSQKSLIYRKDMEPGTELKKDDLYALRPLDGIPIFRLDDFIGKTLTKRVLKGHNLSENDFE